jgi:hypothetical protein
MRLLSMRTYTLQEHPIGQIPPYTILYRRQIDEEVSHCTVTIAKMLPNPLTILSSSTFGRKPKLQRRR